MKTILVVDDDRMNLAAARKVLGDIYKVIPVMRGEEAITYLKENPCDMILLDINMPGMDGLQFTEALLKARPKCRVVIVTGFREFEYARKAINLVKEFSNTSVNKAITNINDNVRPNIPKTLTIENKNRPTFFQ